MWALDTLRTEEKCLQASPECGPGPGYNTQERQQVQGSFNNLTHLPPFIFIGLGWRDP